MVSLAGSDRISVTYGIRRSAYVDWCKTFLNNRFTRYLWRFCKFKRSRNKNSLTWVPKIADICGGFAGWFWPHFRYLRAYGAVRRSIDVKPFINNRSTRHLWRFCTFIRPRNKNSLTWVPKIADICGGFAGWFWPHFRYLRAYGAVRRSIDVKLFFRFSFLVDSGLCNFV